MPHQPLKRPRSPNALSARSLVILFLATLSVSFMLLLILFQVVFKNIHLQFNTRTPETAPTLSNQPSGFFHAETPMFQRMGVQSASIQTPGRTGRVASPSHTEEPTPIEASLPSTENTLTESTAPLPTLPPIHSNTGATTNNATNKTPPLPSLRPLTAPKTLPLKATNAPKPLPSSVTTNTIEPE